MADAYSSSSDTQSKGFGYMHLDEFFSDVGSDSDYSDYSDNEENEKTKKIKLDSEEKAKVKEKAYKEKVKKVEEYFKSLRDYRTKIRTLAAKIDAGLTERIDAEEKDKNEECSQTQDAGIDVGDTPNSRE